MELDCELVIIGGGPSGAGAGVYAARKRLNTILVTEEFGGQSVVSPLIYNWIGTTEISGQALADSFEKHLKYYEGDTFKVVSGKKATSIQKTKQGFEVSLRDDSVINTKAILICTGSTRRKLDDAKVKNADKFEHKGLTYCATCDGPLFADQDVLVIGAGNAGLETALQLAAYTNSVKVFNRGDKVRGDAITLKKIMNNDKIELIHNAELTSVNGDKFVNGANALVNGEEKKFNLGGIFVEIGLLPSTNIVRNLVDLNAYNQIKIDLKNNKTSCDGIWAAGDCTDVLYHQNNIAAGESVKAIENIYQTIFN